MFIQMSIHKTKPGKEQLMLDSMHRFGKAITNQPGCRNVFTTKDIKTGKLVGIAIWETREAMANASSVMQSAVADDDFDDWVESEQIFLLEER